MIKKNSFYIATLTLLVLPGTAIAGAQCEGVSAISGNAGCTAGAFESAIGSITCTLFYIVGAISVIFLLIGAIRYITSTGDASRIKQAKDTIFYAIAGIIIAVVAQAIVAFTLTRIAS